METNAIIRRLERMAQHATHRPGEPLFVLSLDDGIALKEAIEMLKKQEPVEPKNGKCPECGYTVHRINYDGLYNGIRHEWFRFCPSCGRVVKWDD